MRREPQRQHRAAQRDYAEIRTPNAGCRTPNGLAQLAILSYLPACISLRFMGD
ncbi:MAG: hypothetical protein LBG47_02530 [Prevotellaceae bacterium]|nr:hypothetical protein [Prevotellaceae bacterium]